MCAVDETTNFTGVVFATQHCTALHYTTSILQARMNTKDLELLMIDPFFLFFIACVLAV